MPHSPFEHGGRRVHGDPRRRVMQQGLGQWREHREERVQAGATSIWKEGEAWGVWGDFWIAAMEGKRGTAMAKHAARLVTGMHKTNMWWHRRYPMEFGGVSGCMACFRCGNEVESTVALNICLGIVVGGVTSDWV